MLESLAFVVAILGCADGGTQCAAARTLPTSYATAAECRAQLTRVLAEHTDLDFPTVMADCRLRGEQLAKVEMPKR
jgi:spermidine synthase